MQCVPNGQCDREDQKRRDHGMRRSRIKSIYGSTSTTYSHGAEMVKKLFDLGADPQATDKHGKTALAAYFSSPHLQLDVDKLLPC
jgi:hypothetical protein